MIHNIPDSLIEKLKGKEEEIEKAVLELKDYAKKDLEEASIKDFKNNKEDLLSFRDYRAGYVDGAKWQKSNLWHDAQGDDLPEIGREVIALQGRKVVFAHRPPEYWDGKNIDTGKITRHYPQTYDKGGWNMPDVTFWLDVKLPEGIE